MRIWHQGFSDFELAPVYRSSLERHLAAVVEPNMEVTIHGLRPGTYDADLPPIEVMRHPYLEDILKHQVIEAALCAERTGYDALALHCFYDPGVREARSLVDIPVIGLFESCLVTSISLGSAVGLLALTEEQAIRHREMAERYGLERRLAATVAVDPSIDEYRLEGGPEATRDIEAGVIVALRRLRALGAEVIVAGDGVLNDFLWRRGITVDGLAVMDATAVLMHHAAYLARLRRAVGLGVSRSGSYSKPAPGELLKVRAFDGRRDFEESAFSGVGVVSELAVP